MGDEERTGDGRDVTMDDGELGALLILSEWKQCCAECHTLTNCGRTVGGVRRVPHRDASFGVHGGSGENDGSDMTSSER